MEQCEHEHYEVIAEEDRRTYCYVDTGQRPVVGRHGRRMKCLVCGCVILSFIGQPERVLPIVWTS